MTCGRTVIGLVEMKQIVWPSGSALAQLLIPMKAPPPARFSTTKFTPRMSLA